MQKTAEFVAKHLNDDTTRLLLEKGKWPDIDMDIAVNSIESRRKLKGKMDAWIENPDLVFPVRLSAEQCSSSATGQYKAELAQCIIEEEKSDWRIIDLTGGLGVDSWFFSQKASKVIYCEMQDVLCTAAKHNFKVLKTDNIDVYNTQITNENCGEIIQKQDPDIVYIDPARRGEGGKKVFLIEECSPDILTLKDDIFRWCRHILIKLSPMADITMVCSRLGKTCREVHVVSTGGECKELLMWMDREWNDEPDIVAVEIHSDQEYSTFKFTISEEKKQLGSEFHRQPEAFLFEPGKALMKAAPFNLIASRFGIYKFGKSTHYYMTDSPEKAEELKSFGKVFKVKEFLNLNKRNLKETGKKYPKAEVTARNIPMDTDTLRKKLGVTSGDDAHIFGLRSDSEGNLLIITDRI